MMKPQAQPKPEGLLQNIITYLCFKCVSLSTRKLVKLLYLVEVYYYQLYGKRFTKIPFYRYRYDVWSPYIEPAVEELYEKGVLIEKGFPTKKGFIAIVPKPNVPETEVHLSKDVFEVLNIVVEEWGNVLPDKVVEFTKTTLPFINTGEGEEIDFSRVNGIKEYAKEKGITEEESATLDIISDKTLKENVLKGLKDIQEGKILSYEEVFNE